MKKPIQDILKAACAVAGMKEIQVLHPKKDTERLQLARMLFIYLASLNFYRTDKIARFANIDLLDARYYLSKATRMSVSSIMFKRRVQKALGFMNVEENIIEAPKQKKDPFWTEEDERRINNACLEAMRFMQQFGLPREDGTIRKALVDGVGYYPTPITLS